MGDDMYMNITTLRMHEVFVIECFLSQFGYDSEIEKIGDKVILKLKKDRKTRLESEPDPSEIREIIPIKEV